MALDEELQRTGARSTFIIDLSIDIDFQELIEEGPEPFLQRARAMLEERLKPLQAIPWEGVRNTLRPAPEIRREESAISQPEPATQSPDTSPQS